jgi:hypothetical protein
MSVGLDVRVHDRQPNHVLALSGNIEADAAVATQLVQGYIANSELRQTWEQLPREVIRDIDAKWQQIIVDRFAKNGVPACAALELLAGSIISELRGREEFSDISIEVGSEKYQALKRGIVLVLSARFIADPRDIINPALFNGA